MEEIDLLKKKVKKQSRQIKILTVYVIATFIVALYNLIASL